MKKSKKTRFVCGTPAGYARHLRRHERPCRYCLVGSETYNESEILELIDDFQTWSSEQRLWKTHQLSRDRFNQIFVEQGQRCGCCLRADPGEAPWHIDHDHQTGLIRGILCTSCNIGLKHLGDNLDSLKQALAYLQAHQTRGGYGRAQNPPELEQPLPKISAAMQQCFDLFRQGAPCNRVVVLLKLAPAVVTEIYNLWIFRGGKIDPIRKHLFQIPKDPPRRFMCACGYAAPWNDPNEMNTAIARVNEHIKETQDT